MPAQAGIFIYAAISQYLCEYMHKRIDGVRRLLLYLPTD